MSLSSGATSALMPSAGLSAAIEQLGRASTTEDIVEVVRGCARGLIGSDGIALVMRDGDHCHYVEEDAAGPLWKGRRFPMVSCISGWSMLHRQTVAISDIFLDQRIPHDLYRATFVRSLVMAPIRSGRWAPTGSRPTSPVWPRSRPWKPWPRPRRRR
ncbi:MAG: hypothetical protein P4M07_16870 [Xanthobacteraceae bacterium]|nr:hypothetical protein [Xanthobacteraceae bacterium]